ncbi:MAG TPA: LptA/OstA family protein [bacterium]|jgi:lipopolysaccharide export system protein LptA|nr:LptA/OstA family protein [bacterium]
MRKLCSALLLGLTALAPAAQLRASGATPAPAALSPTGAPSDAADAKKPGTKALLQGGKFDEKQPISIQGRTVHFNQDNETLLAEGNVVLVSGDTQVHAERLWYDMKQGTLRAEGDVVVADASGNTLWAQRLAMNQVSRTGQAEDIVYAQAPWTAACGGADILPGNVVVLHGCECTSCLQENPMWRIWAKTLKMKAGDKLWAWGVWFYTGRVPVFYVPYFSKSLKDPRAPIEIKPGYSTYLGSYLGLGYNYFLDDGEYGTVRYDWMENVGNGYGLGQHYKFWGGEGTVAGYYNNNVKDSSLPPVNYSLNLTHKQVLGTGLTLMANVDLLSNPDFNQIFNINQVDTYQQRDFVDLQSVQKGYNWSIQASKTVVLETLPSGSSSVQNVTQTVTSQELLPSATFNIPPTPLRYGSLVEWGFSSSAGRSLVTPQVLENISGTPVVAYAPYQNYFLDGVTLSPTISDTFPIRRGLALNGTLGLNTGWVKAEGTVPQGVTGTPVTPSWGAILAGYDSSFDLQARLRPGVVTDLIYSYQRELAPVAGLLWSGEQLNQLEWKMQAQLTKPLSVLLDESYDMRPWLTDNALERLSLFYLQSSWAPGGDHSATLSTGFDVPDAVFKTVDAAYNINDPRKLWQANLTVDWVNNTVEQVEDPQDATAPYEFAYQDPRITPDQLFAGLRNSLVLGPKWKVSYYEQLDLVNRRVNEQAYTLDRDFNCIELQLYAHQNLTAGWQYGFSISLSAAPGVKFDTNQLNDELFNPAQYGY